MRARFITFGNYSITSLVKAQLTNSSDKLIDLMALMAQAGDPPAKDPPNKEPPLEDPPSKDPPIEEPGKPPSLKSA